jgi:hypothetical protein
MLTRLNHISSSSSTAFNSSNSNSYHQYELETPSDVTSLSSQSGRELNMLQQHAMNEFLEAQLNGCPIRKEEKWRELVRVMRQEETGHRRRGSRSRGSRSRSRSRGSNRSWSNDEVLGFIRVGGEESIASGLTSPTTSPMVSPGRKYILPTVRVKGDASISPLKNSPVGCARNNSAGTPQSMRRRCRLFRPCLVIKSRWVRRCLLFRLSPVKKVAGYLVTMIMILASFYILVEKPLPQGTALGIPCLLLVTKMLHLLTTGPVAVPVIGATVS